MRLSERGVLALSLLGAGAMGSYVLQRLIDASTEPPIGTVLAQAHIPYYWRMAVAALHGVVLAALSLGLSAGWRARLLSAAPWWIGALCAATVLAMLAVP